MARFYDKNGAPRLTVPRSDGKGIRSTRITDAKKNDWYASVSTICGALGPFDGLTYWFKTEPLKYAASVKEIDLLKESGEKWVKKMLEGAEKEMSKAADLGSRVHESCELYHRWRADNKEMSIGPFPHDIKPYIRAIDSFCDENGIVGKKDQLEKPVVLKDTRSAGTVDFGGVGFNGKKIILDWKTQKVKRDVPRFWLKYRMQVCAYASAFNPDLAGVVIIDTSDRDNYSRDNLPKIYYDLYTHEEQVYYYGLFKKLSDLYYASQDWL